MVMTLGKAARLSLVSGRWPLVFHLQVMVLQLDGADNDEERMTKTS